jgi:mono/diheme cytochrome c family protein
MLKALILGFVLGVLLVCGGVYWYFSTGRAPVAVSAPEMPMEHKLARMALHAYLDKLPHPNAPVPADEPNMIAGAQIYKENCAVCHSLPGGEKSAIADGMFPKPPHLFRGTGVTDDEAWETYWKVENGIRMTGMPGFKGRLNETQIWQVTQLVKNADKISDAAKAALLGTSGAAMAPVTMAAPAGAAAPHK